MLYRGRHRRAPDPIPGGRAAAVGLLGITGSLLPAGMADAAPDANWGAIAMCESGGQNIRTRIAPHLNTASGYFQITNGTWKGAGGREFAPTAMQATKAQQLIVAKRIAAARGSLADWSESRSCWSKARKGGMTLAETDTPKVAPKAAVKTTTLKATPKAPAPARVKAGRGLPQIPDGYRIRRGDTLGKIARRFHVPGGYRAVAKANGIANPNLIIAGARLS